MRSRRIIIVVCVLIFIYQAADADPEDISTETSNLQPVYVSTESSTNMSESEGPPDSHEAMNTRVMKPKITESTRRKRSYEFLVGLVRNHSRFDITKSSSKKYNDINSSKIDNDIDMMTTGNMMELLVKIAAHPKEWNIVHELLDKIDGDLKKSKHILDIIEKSPTSDTTSPPHETSTYPAATTSSSLSTTSSHSIVNSKKWSLYDNAIAELDEKIHPSGHQHYRSSASPNEEFGRNFIYHRVTGRPQSFRDGGGAKMSKAYIAVSVIAPKPLRSVPDSNRLNEELTLENELRQLRPWSHQQNLKNMADLRSKWIIQSDDAITEQQQEHRSFK